MRRPEFPWREGNDIQLIVDAAQFYPAMLEAINQARESVLLEMYLVSSGAVMDLFIQALGQAAQRGVSVRVLFDHYGARDLGRRDRQRMRDTGVELVFYNPLSLGKWSANLSRDHRKLLVVDYSLAFIGGSGLTDEYLYADPTQRETPWHELMCRVRGPVVADLVGLFERLWCRSLGSALEGGRIQLPETGAARIRVLTSEGPTRQHLKLSVLRSIHFSRKRVWICTAYFLPSLSLRLALRYAARRGLDVRLLVAGPLTDHRWIYHASKRYYRRLLNAGVRIYEYQPRMLHSKIALLDERVSVGSCNLDHWNLRWNQEANIEVDERTFSESVVQLFERDFADSEEITAEAWAKRPWTRKLKELIWALVCQWILRIR